MVLPHILPPTLPSLPPTVTVSSSTTAISGITATTATTATPTPTPPQRAARATPKSIQHVQAARARKRSAPQRCPHCSGDLRALPPVLAKNVQIAETVTRLVLDRHSVTSAAFANLVGIPTVQARYALNAAAREKLLVRRREQARDGRYHYRYDPTPLALAYFATPSLARALADWFRQSDDYA